MAELDTFMQQLAKDLEIEASLSTDVPGVYAFPVDEEAVVFISSIPRGFELSCSAAECLKGEEELFYKQALFANLYGKGSEGCVIGLNQEGERLTLSKTVTYTVDYREFFEIIEDFLNSVEFWRNEVSAYGTKLE